MVENTETPETTNVAVGMVAAEVGMLFLDLAGARNTLSRLKREIDEMRSGYEAKLREEHDTWKRMFDGAAQDREDAYSRIQELEARLRECLEEQAAAKKESAREVASLKEQLKRAEKSLRENF